MNNSNYIAGVVKLLEVSKEKLLHNKILVTEGRVYLPQAKTNKIVHVVFWGKSANEISNNYKVNDYILIEGFLSLCDKKNSKTKKVEITVFKFYPIFLNSDRSISKTAN